MTSGRFCTHHCAACGEHFCSLEAFDLHRAGQFSESRYCLPPDDVAALAVVSTAATCRLVRGVDEVPGVTLYASKRHLEDRQGAIQRLRVSERRPGIPQGGVRAGAAA